MQYAWHLFPCSVRLRKYPDTGADQRGVSSSLEYKGQHESIPRFPKHKDKHISTPTISLLLRFAVLP